MMVVWQPLVSVKEEPKEYIQQTDEKAVALAKMALL